MGLYIASVASLALWTAVAAAQATGANSVGRTDGGMVESRMIYRIEEHGSNGSIQTAVNPQGGVEIKISLLQPFVSHTWHFRLDREAFALCAQAIESVQRHYLPVRTPFYQIETDTGEGMTKVAAWSKEDEAPDFAAVRQRLDQSLHTAYFMALAYLQVGTEEEGKHDLNKAGLAYKQGVRELGDAYRDTGALDDTGMKLVLAQSTEKRDGMTKAAPMFQRVLESRTASYARREHLAADRVQ